MKSYGIKSEILLDQEAVTQMIIEEINENPDFILMTIYLN